MSTSDVTETKSLKRKLKDSELDTPPSKRQKTNDTILNEEDSNSHNHQTEEQKNESIAPTMPEPTDEATNESSNDENIKNSQNKTLKKKKRFIAESDSEPDDDEKSQNTNLKKFIYGNTVQTLGQNLTEIEEKNGAFDDEEEDDEDDDDLNGFVVDDVDDSDDENNQMMNHRILRRNVNNDNEEDDDFLDDDDDEINRRNHNFELEADDADDDEIGDEDEEDIEESDGESLNSMDDDIERQIDGTEDMSLADLTFDNAVKRKSLSDLIQIFENGFELKQTDFFTNYAHFIKVFDDKAIRALKLLKILLPHGFGDSNQKLINCANDKIEIDAKENQREFEFYECIKHEKFDQIPALLKQGICPRLIPKFFLLIEQFRTKIVEKWFEAITFQNIELMEEYYALYGIPIDLHIPRKLIRKILETDFEHLEGATGLVIASLVNSTKIAKFFVDHGADIEFETQFGGDTALMHSAKQGNIEIVKYLLDKGANIDAMTSESEAYSDTFSHVAFETLNAGKLDVLEYLAYFGADLYLKGPCNMSGERVNVICLCLMSEKLGMNEIKNGLKRRFDLVKKCLSALVSSDVDIMDNISSIICDEYLSPLRDEYVCELIDQFMIECDD